MRHVCSVLRSVAFSLMLIGLPLAGLAVGAAEMACPAGAACAPAGQAHQPENLDELKSRFRRPHDIPFPKRNPYSDAGVALGKALFFDPRLSRAANMSCASCHNPGLGWSDGLERAVGFGMKTLHRRTPGVLNLAWGLAFQWDGRADSLEAQARMPLTAPDEMNMTMPELVERLAAIPGYRPMFEVAFPMEKEPVSARTLVAALATYQRTLVSGAAPFDRWIEGDEAAISQAAQRGFILFSGKAGCANCHAGWRFTDDSFHDIGLKAGTDTGRGAFVPETVVAMRHAFKTPGLRDLNIRGPYMHDGQLATLDDVMAHYEHGGEARPSLSADMRPLNLSAQDKADLVAFIETLRGPPLKVELPQLP